MVNRIVQLDGDIVYKLYSIYRESGHPLGKNRRGRKKWISRFVHKVLRKKIDEQKLDNLG